MKVAVAPIYLKVTACGDDLSIDQTGVGLALDLAEVWGLPATQQGLEEGVLLATTDVHLDVTAAGCPTGMVGRSARGGRARVRIRSDR